MRRPFAAALVAVLLFAYALAANAEEDIAVQGEVVDLACYLSQGKKGSEHKACAQMCAKGGVPMGVLTDSGELYLLIDDHSNSAPYEAAKKLAGARAQISGKKFVKNGMASIMVTAAAPQ